MLHHLHHTTDYVTSVHDERVRRGTRVDSTDISRAMKAAEKGDANAWAMLISRFRGHVARVARSYGLNAYQVDDVSQETWLRLYRHIGSVRDPHALGAWLGTTASRESLRALAGDRREESTDEELFLGTSNADDVADSLARSERSQALKRALETLPPRHRTLMESLLAEPEPSYAEISDRLGIPIGSIGPIRGRCVTRLRRELIHAGVMEAEAA
jgi:RNA polymerase sigma factor (sigma-70 family)